MSGSLANFPIKVTLEGAETVEGALRRVAQGFADQVQAANSVTPAVASAGDALGRFEQRANAAQRGINELRGALDLLGAGGAAGALGPVASGIGNVADLFATAGVAAGRLGTALSSVSVVAAPLAIGVASVSAAAYGLSTAYEAAAKRAEEARQAEEAYRTALELSDRLLRQTTQTQEGAIAARRQEAIAANSLAIAIERENMARANEAASRAASIASRLQEAVATGRAAPGQVEATLARARDTALGIASEAQRISDRIAGLEGANATLRSMIYPVPAGPPAPTATQLLAASRGANDDDSGFWRAEETARRAASAAISADQRARDQIERQFFESAERMERQSIESFARIGENAADRIGTGLVQAFVSGQGAAVNFGSLLNSVIASAAADLAKLGLINPASNAIFGTSRPTLVGAFSGLGGISNLLPGGLGSSVSGFLSTPLFSTGQFTAGETAFLQAAGVANPGMFTLGSALGYAGAGAVGGGLIASLTGGNQLGGSIGGAGGALAGAAIGSIVPGVGTVLGALIGGAAGGGLGGLFGNSGAGFQGGDALIAVGPDGLLRVSGAAGKGFDTAGLVASAQQQVAALNAQLRSAGIFLNPDLAGQQYVAAIGGGQSGNPTDLMGALARGNLSGQLRSNDPRLQAALSGGDFASALNEAARLGQLRQAGAAGISGLADYASGLRLANDNSGNPLTRLTTAEQQFAATADAARRGDLGAIGRLPQVAEQYRQLSRGVFGTGQGFAAAEQRIIAALDGVTSAGADQLTASFFSETVDSQTIRLEDALSRLTAEVAGLRADTRQASTNPLLARAA